MTRLINSQFNVLINESEMLAYNKYKLCNGFKFIRFHPVSLYISSSAWIYVLYIFFVSLILVVMKVVCECESS